MVCDQVQEPGQLVGFLPHAGVEEGLIALAAAPQDVVLPAQPLGRRHRVADLRGGMGDDLGVGVGGRTRGVAGVAEQVGGAPQQLDARVGHLLPGAVDQPVEVGPRLAQGGTWRGHVDVVEAEVGHAQLGDELEGRVLLGEGRLHLVLSADKPGPVEGAGAEHVAARPVEAVPVAHGDAQVFGHGRAADLAVGVVHAVGNVSTVGVGTRQGDALGYVGEEVGHAFILA